MNSKLRDKIKELYKDLFIPAHDIKHILRVAGLAVTIAEGEKYDTNEAEATALLHDIGRLKANEESHAGTSEKEAKNLLDEYTKFDISTKNRILDAIKQHPSKESYGQLAHIFQDADKLDGLGAIGLVRAYTSKSHLIDYPEGVIVDKGNRSAKTISEQVTFQMEWYKMLYTKTAKKIAEQRFKFMKEFMRELKREVEESIKN